MFYESYLLFIKNEFAVSLVANPEIHTLFVGVYLLNLIVVATLVTNWICPPINYHRVCVLQRNEKSATQVRRSTRHSSRKENEPIPPKRQKKTKTKSVSFKEKVECKPGKALKYLKSFLDLQSNCSYQAFTNPSWFRVIFSITKTLQKCQVCTSFHIFSCYIPQYFLCMNKPLRQF